MADAVPDNFLGLSGRQADYASARFAVLPIPYDATTSYAVGTREGPRAIITASQQVELYDELLDREPYKAGVATLDALEPDVRGPEQMDARIFNAARKVVRDGKFLFGLGGEHSVTAGLVRAVRTKYKQLAVLQIDAHADLRDQYQGSPYSHASVMRRVHDLGVKAVGVGIRNLSAEEAKFIRQHELPIFMARHCHTRPGGPTQQDWIEVVVSHLREWGRPVYVTIDIDGFDPAFAPGTGTPEPGGLDWHQVNHLLDVVTRDCEVVGADIVEVKPIPPNHVTEFLAARLAYRLMGYVTRK